MASDERVQAFLNRPLEGDWPFLWLDATYVKLREGGRIVSMAVIVAVAVNSDGRREILGITVMPSEAETFWADFLRSLTRRGLRGVQLVISDAHEGLKAAARKVLGAGWQRCRVHFQRNLLTRVGKTNNPVVSAVVKTVFAETDRDQAHARWREVADNLRDRFRDVAELMDEAEHDVPAYMAFDESLRLTLHSTNPPERVNKEIKRRTNVVGVRRENSAPRCFLFLLTPQPRGRRPPRRRAHAGTERRMDRLTPLHAGRKAGGHVQRSRRGDDERRTVNEQNQL